MAVGFQLLFLYVLESSVQHLNCTFHRNYLSLWAYSWWDKGKRGYFGRKTTINHEARHSRQLYHQSGNTNLL